VTTHTFSKQFGELDLSALVDELAVQAKSVNNGDLQRAEAMLIAQAHTLDAIFNSLARRSHHAEYLPQLETFLRLGLKAQSQCRATLETLAAIKNPAPVAFVRQANIAHGPQQVNNGSAAPAQPSRAPETDIEQNKLLEQQHGERLDPGAAQATVGADPALATLGQIDGTTHRTG
jgi:hypothetical protein